MNVDVITCKNRNVSIAGHGRAVAVATAKHTNFCCECSIFTDIKAVCVCIKLVALSEIESHVIKLHVTFKVDSGIHSGEIKSTAGYVDGLVVRSPALACGNCADKVNRAVICKHFNCS